MIECQHFAHLLILVAGRMADYQTMGGGGFAKNYKKNLFTWVRIFTSHFIEYDSLFIHPTYLLPEQNMFQ